MTPFETTVAELASLHGIEPGYWDISGHWHETSHELRLAILAALGVSCAELECAEESLRRIAESRPWVEPVIVMADSEREHGIPVRLPPGGSGPIRASVTLEDGARRELAWSGDDPALPVPGDLPHGYHEVVLSAHEEARVRLILTPDRAWLPEFLERDQRRAGVAVSLYGLRGKNTWGAGDFAALRPLIDWVASDIGGTYIALNPLHAILNRQPFNTSPYLPNSLFYRNFLYLAMDEVPEMETCEAARALRERAETAELIERLNEAEFVEYEQVAGLKLRFLELCWENFQSQHLVAPTERGRAFLAWVEAEGDLLDQFALYSALDAVLHAADANVWIWPDWPEHYKNPASPEVGEFRREHAGEILFHKYIQFLVDEQAARAQQYALSRGMEIGLFHDLPLATDRCGAELWAHGGHYVTGCRVGSPPDGFAPRGQDWSFPPPDRERHRLEAYRLFAESIRKSARHGGALRIDHVMRLFRLYWIPDGLDATQGTYVRDYHRDLLRVLALESHRQRILIVGEDLGTVEPVMRQELDGFGVLSYRLFYFERNPDGSFKSSASYPVNALVSSTTHDLPTLAGFWASRDIETRHALGLLVGAGALDRDLAARTAGKHRVLDRLIEEGLLPAGYDRSAADSPELAGDLHDAITGFLASTPCLLMTLNEEDLTKEPDQQNLPGTTWQYPNWRRKMAFRVDQLHTDALAQAFAAMLRHWLARERRFHASFVG